MKNKAGLWKHLLHFQPLLGNILIFESWRVPNVFCWEGLFFYVNNHKYANQLWVTAYCSIQFPSRKYFIIMHSATLQKKIHKQNKWEYRIMSLLLLNPLPIFSVKIHFTCCNKTVPNNTSNLKSFAALLSTVLSWRQAIIDLAE